MTGRAWEVPDPATSRSSASAARPTDAWSRLRPTPAGEDAARAAGPIDIDGWMYHCTDNGRHPRQADEITLTSFDRVGVIDGFRFVDTIAPRPLLMIIGTEAVTRWMGEDAIDRAGEPKELFWIDGAGHVDLYKPEYVTPAIAKLTDYFNANLGAETETEGRGVALRAPARRSPGSRTVG